MNLTKITEDEYDAYIAQLEAKTKGRRSNAGAYFVLRGKVHPGMFIELTKAPRSRYVEKHSHRSENNMLAGEVGFECKLQAFKVAGPFCVKIAGRIRAESDEGGFFKFTPEPKNVLREFGDTTETTGLLARCDTLSLTAGVGGSFVEAEFVATAIVDDADLIREDLPS